MAEAVRVARADNPALRAICAPRYEAALARDADLAHGDPQGPLHRVPYTLKDVWDVAGLPTSWGRPGAPIAAASGPVHRAFESAGAVLLGKSNLSDLAITPECQSSLGGVTRHPLDPSRTPGGSSGGAAVAVATGMARFDWGSDYGGSVRLPAAWCGVVGLRLASRAWPVPGDRPPDGVAALFAMGPIAADLATCRAVLDAARPLRAAAPVPAGEVGVLRFGPDVWSAGRWRDFDFELATRLAERGVPSWPAPLPAPRAFDRAFVALLAAHAPALLARRGVTVADCAAALAGRPGLAPASARVALELTALHRLVHRDRPGAVARAEALRAKVAALFEGGFVIATPTTTVPAPRHGRALRTPGATAFVKLGSLVDATALSVPFGRFAGGLPRGLQLLGPAGSEESLLDLAERIAGPK